MDILSMCPNAQVLFVSATMDGRAIAKVKSVVFGGGRGGGGGGASGRALVSITTDQKSRPCFQTNFTLAPHESKIETMRRLNENVQRAGKKLLFSNRIEDVENIARK